MRKGLERLLLVSGTLCFVVVSVLAVRAFLPEERAPSREKLADGTVQFVLQSQRDAASWPVGAAALALSLLVLSWWHRRTRGKGGEEQPRPHVVARVLLWLLVASLVFLFVKLTLFDPLLRFRSLLLTPREVSMRSLYRTWSVPAAEVLETQVERYDTSRRGGECTDLCYVIRDVHGSTYRSIVTTCSRPSPELAQYVRFFEALDREVKKRLQR
jgi:hypothetical protein